MKYFRKCLFGIQIPFRYTLIRGSNWERGIWLLLDTNNISFWLVCSALNRRFQANLFVMLFSAILTSFWLNFPLSHLNHYSWPLLWKMMVKFRSLIVMVQSWKYHIVCYFQIKICSHQQLNLYCFFSLSTVCKYFLLHQNLNKLSPTLPHWHWLKLLIIFFESMKRVHWW